MLGAFPGARRGPKDAAEVGAGAQEPAEYWSRLFKEQAVLRNHARDARSYRNLDAFDFFAAFSKLALTR